ARLTLSRRRRRPDTPRRPRAAPRIARGYRGEPGWLPAGRGASGGACARGRRRRLRLAPPRNGAVRARGGVALRARKEQREKAAPLRRPEGKRAETLSAACS